MLEYASNAISAHQIFKIFLGENAQLWESINGSGWHYASETISRRPVREDILSIFLTGICFRCHLSALNIRNFPGEDLQIPLRIQQRFWLSRKPRRIKYSKLSWENNTTSFEKWSVFLGAWDIRTKYRQFSCEKFFPKNGFLLIISKLIIGVEFLDRISMSAN